MKNIIQFQYDAVDNLRYSAKEGHYYLHVPTFFSSDNEEYKTPKELRCANIRMISNDAQ